jgi:uncharacterized protein (TIGR03643 family)
LVLSFSSIVKIQTKPPAGLSAADISEVIEMALSDHVSFNQLRALHGLSADDVQALMRQQLKRGSYLAWRKRIQAFSERRASYK